MSNTIITDLVIDLETLSLNPSEKDGIIQISAVGFNRYTRNMYDTVSFNVLVKHPKDFELVGATYAWWNKTNPEYLTFIFKNAKMPLDSALLALAKWIGNHNTGNSIKAVWGNGVGFDNAFLTNAYAKHLIPLPWSYKQDACFRTFKTQLCSKLYKNNKDAALCFTENLGKSTDHWHEHNALFDATYEAVQLSEMFAFLEDKGIEI